MSSNATALLTGSGKKADLLAARSSTFLGVSLLLPGKMAVLPTVWPPYGGAPGTKKSPKPNVCLLRNAPIHLQNLLLRQIVKVIEVTLRHATRLKR